MKNYQCVEYSGECLIETEEPEGLHVVVAYACPDPRAMVVHLGHADATSVAVVRPIGLPGPAKFAFEVLGDVWVVRDPLRLLQSGDPVGNLSEYYTDV